MTKPNPRILVIGDAHEPYAHPKYLSHCINVYKQNKCNFAISVGDFVDNHAISYHEKNVGLPNANDELGLAIKILKKWQEAFPKLKVCIGNHDDLPARKRQTAGLPSLDRDGYARYYETPGWEWQREFIIPAFHHNLWFRHSWAKGHMNAGGLGGYSIICGHTHTEAGFKWSQYPSHSSFALYTGCGINPKHPAFDYGKDNGKQPVLACATIIEGQPQIHRMWA